MNEQRNLILTVLLTALILLGWNFLWPSRLPVHPVAQQSDSPAPNAPPVLPGQMPQSAAAPESQLISLLAAPRVKVGSKELRGSIALTGARIDDISLTRFHQTEEADSPDITLLAPAAGPGAYYAEFGWVAGGDSKITLPTADSLWTADSDSLTPDHPVTLSWDNGQGLKFIRRFALDDGAMFTVTDKVENSGGSEVTLFPYGLLSRWGTPVLANLSILHEGALGVLDGSLKEMKYKKLREDEHMVDLPSTGGWLGFTDKYWLTALVPDQAMSIDGRMSWRHGDGLDRYQADWLGIAQKLPAGGSIETTSHLFTGAKELAVLDAYATQYSIPLFDHAIDFGWLYFITKPLFLLLRTIHSHVPNFGVAILLLTVLIRGAMFPIANRSFKSMNKMRKIQPQMKALQEKFVEDKGKLQQEMMALYKREGVNPVAGCLPVLLQIPVFFALYKVLYVTIEMRQAPFFGWIHDLSAPDPTSLLNLFGLLPFAAPTFLHIGALPLIMGATMFLQQRLNPQPADPVQAKIFMFMPLIFTFTLATSPVGLVLYWSWSNMLSILQQWVMMKRHPA